jgi:ATP-dependent RNA helicase RhlE
MGAEAEYNAFGQFRVFAFLPLIQCGAGFRSRIQFMTFNDLNLIEPILRALQEEGYTNPTPVQEAAIPIVLNRNDLLACAQTGTGKTAAFSIPMLQLMQASAGKQSQQAIRCLILTPTRELAIQIGESLAAYGRHLTLRHTVIFGGVPQNPQVQALKRGIDILVATPGRLHDLIQQNFIRLNQLEYFVLDEADRMLDMGFIHDVRKVVKLLPERRQNLFFSATMPEEIQKLADQILRNPLKVEVTPVSSTAEKVQQFVYFVSKPDKRKLLDWMLRQKMGKEPVLVFTRTKHGADRVARDMVKMGHTAEAIHGDKAQNARQRALNNFKTGKTRVLVATDIAARGIDIDQLAFVLNYELPNVPETYVHRIGRTGRAGNEGTAFSFCMDDEKPYLKDIQKLIRKEVAILETPPNLVSEPVAVAVFESKPVNQQNRKQMNPMPTAEKPKNARNNRRRRFWSKTNTAQA